jgi:hypothetical protein
VGLGLALYRGAARSKPWRARQGKGLVAAQASWPCWPWPLARWAPQGGRLGRGGCGSGLRARPRKEGFFFEFIFNAETNSRKVYKLFKGTKNTPKITKIPGQFLEIDYDMNNPNKAFGAHAKDFRGF